MLKMSISASQETHHVSITKTNRYMVFTLTVGSERNTQINAVSEIQCVFCQVLNLMTIEV